MNGGTCSDAVNMYSCDCPTTGSGFYGANCESKSSMEFLLFGIGLVKLVELGKFK